MTAPDLPTWTVEEDYDGDPTLWYGDIAILRQFELESHGLRRAELPIDLLWAVLTRVLAPDEATIDLVAEALYEAQELVPRWNYKRYSDFGPDQLEFWRRKARAGLSALAGTSAQARHTDGEATGGGEHG